MAANPLARNRVCKKCGTEKEETVENFPARKRYRGGLSTWCRDCENAQAREWREKNRERSNSVSKRWRDENIDQMREIYRRNNARRVGPAAIRSRVSAAIWRQLKGVGGSKEGAKWEAVLGWTMADLRSHLERQFHKGMSWDNYGKWQIDHITPVSSFKVASVYDDEFRACWALSNLRPLLAGDNASKRDRRTLLL